MPTRLVEARVRYIYLLAHLLTMRACHRRPQTRRLRRWQRATGALRLDVSDDESVPPAPSDSTSRTMRACHRRPQTRRLGRWERATGALRLDVSDDESVPPAPSDSTSRTKAGRSDVDTRDSWQVFLFGLNWWDFFLQTRIQEKLGGENIHLIFSFVFFYGV